MNFSIHPFILVAALAGLVAVGATILAFRVSRAGQCAFLTMIALLCILPAIYLGAQLRPELVDARFRAYKNFYGEIHEGMSRDEVLAVMERRYPAGGPRQRPKVMSEGPGDLGFFMNPESSREPNCEGILLTLHEGRVTRKVYLVD